MAWTYRFANAGDNSWTLTGSGFPTTVTTGDSLTLDDPSGDETGDTVRVIWQSDAGGSSNTIGESTVPT